MGAFVDNSLIAGERIEARARTSWLSQFWYFVFAGLVLWLITVTYSSEVQVVGLFLVLVSVLLAVINVNTTELAISNKKIIGKTGFVRRESIDLPLDKLESVSINQGVLGRILGYGVVTIGGVGGNKVSIPFIKAPLLFRRVVMNVIDKNQGERQ